MELDRRSFVFKNTRLQRLLFVPEVQLHLGEEITPLWRLIQDEQEEADAPPPYWAFAWVGGQAVARYLLDHPGEVRAKRVLDIASGSGLCAIAAMRSGAASALAADVDPFSEEAVALNARPNDVEVDFTGLDLLDAEPPKTDLILAGDVCYERGLAARVLPWLAQAHARGIRVLVGDPERPFLPRDLLVLLEEYEVPTTRDLEDREMKRTGVFTFPTRRTLLA
jgi:predicted nicotinamide N-methyase